MGADRDRRLAAALHDGPVQELTIARMQLDLLRRSVDDAALAGELAALDRSLETAAARLRELMAALVEDGA